MTIDIWQDASRLLCYPDEDLYAEPPVLAGFPWMPPPELARHYVETFDLRRRCCLYMTYYRDGDTRRRGASLAALKARYRADGLELAGGELPDFLPVMLEFCALTGSPDLLIEHRPGLELLRMALADRSSPYAGVIEAVCGTLPGPGPKDRAEALRMAQAGPPTETVGVYG